MINPDTSTPPPSRVYVVNRSYVERCLSDIRNGVVAYWTVVMAVAAIIGTVSLVVGYQHAASDNLAQVLPLLGIVWAAAALFALFAGIVIEIWVRVRAPWYPRRWRALTSIPPFAEHLGHTVIIKS